MTTAAESRSRASHDATKVPAVDLFADAFRALEQDRADHETDSALAEVRRQAQLKAAEAE